MDRMTGVITQVRLSKGFAFLRGTSDRMSRFVYAKDVEPISDFDTMHEGQQVSFEPAGVLNTTPDAKNNGLRAIKVRRCQ